MSLSIASLNSGSNANCYYIGGPQEAVLIDAGLSCRETEKRMKKLGLSLEKVKALFISHEHSDHIIGMAGLAKKYQLPVYITQQTLRHSNMPLAAEQVFSFRHARGIVIGEMTVFPFRKSHDAVDPHSFLISRQGTTVAVITDIGYACKEVIRHFSLCQAVFLEANYCDDMLEKGAYPYHLKKRIRSDQGHLSNAQALELFRQYRSPQLQWLILSHLSKHNNKPELVQQLFEPHAGNARIFVASRYEPSPVFEISGHHTQHVVKALQVKKPRSMPGTNKKQLSLFD